MSKPPLTTSFSKKQERTRLRKMAMRPIFRSGDRLDDPGVLTRPFRSIHFVVTSVMGFGCVVVDGFVLHRYWQWLSAGVAAALMVLVGVQVLYQAWQIFRIVPMIEEFDAIASDENLAPDSPLGEAIDASVTLFVDRLFFSYGITLALLGVLAKVLALRHPL